MGLGRRWPRQSNVRLIDMPGLLVPGSMAERLTLEDLKDLDIYILTYSHPKPRRSLERLQSGFEIKLPALFRGLLTISRAQLTHPAPLEGDYPPEEQLCSAHLPHGRGPLPPTGRPSEARLRGGPALPVHRLRLRALGHSVGLDHSHDGC